MANFDRGARGKTEFAGKIYLIFDNLSFNCVWYFLCFAGLNFKPKLSNDMLYKGVIPNSLAFGTGATKLNSIP